MVEVTCALKSCSELPGVSENPKNDKKVNKNDSGSTVIPSLNYGLKSSSSSSSLVFLSCLAEVGSVFLKTILLCRFRPSAEG